ncbi:hypothetical protein NQZ68_016012 [Dissostichus eleginoides]|nr:hypothetical protein NQZ68_016012 [Dissostichus eleginoides]
MNSITGRVLAIPAASVTSSGASSSRALHVELTSQQSHDLDVVSVWLQDRICAVRRLRHLRSIAARNIVNKNGSPLLDTYFTLHLCIGERISREDQDDVISCRLVIIRITTMTKDFLLDFGMLPDLLDTSVSCFVVRIWGGQEEQFQLLIEWKVNLDGLRYTGQQDQSERKKNSLLQVDLSSVRNSYSLSSTSSSSIHTQWDSVEFNTVTLIPSSHTLLCLQLLTPVTEQGTVLMELCGGVYRATEATGLIMPPCRQSSDLLARWLDAEPLSHAMLVWSCVTRQLYVGTPLTPGQVLGQDQGNDKEADMREKEGGHNYSHPREKTISDSPIAIT